MDALSVVLQSKQLDELYRLRKAVFLPKWLLINAVVSSEWQEVRELSPDRRGLLNISEGHQSLGASIMKHSYRYSPEHTFLMLKNRCKQLGLPFPDVTWKYLVENVQHVVEFHSGCHSDQEMFGTIGQESHWSEHRKLFLYLGLFGKDDQDTVNLDSHTWVDQLYAHPGLRVRQLVDLHASLQESEYSDDDWEADEWPFAIDAELNPETNII